MSQAADTEPGQMATAEPRSFGVVLSRYRVAAGLTQEKLAERAGLSVEAISTLERGVVRRPRPSTVRQLLDALQLSPDDRASFEQAARTASATAPVGDAPPVGTFLGARPATAIVGRGEELARIRSILDTVAEGAGQLLLLSGEIGVGKTRLLQELTVEARSRGYLAATGRCYGTGQTSPFSPVIEALSDVHATVPATIRSDWQRGWKRIGPLLAAADNGAKSGAILTQREVVGAVGDLLVAVARTVPIAFLLDDL